MIRTPLANYANTILVKLALGALSRQGRGLILGLKRWAGGEGWHTWSGCASWSGERWCILDLCTIHVQVPVRRDGHWPTSTCIDGSHVLRRWLVQVHALRCIVKSVMREFSTSVSCKVLNYLLSPSLPKYKVCKRAYFTTGQTKSKFILFCINSEHFPEN